MEDLETKAFRNEAYFKKICKESPGARRTRSSNKNTKRYLKEKEIHKITKVTEVTVSLCMAENSKFTTIVISTKVLVNLQTAALPKSGIKLCLLGS